MSEPTTANAAEVVYDALQTMLGIAAPNGFRISTLSDVDNAGEVYCMDIVINDSDFTIEVCKKEPEEDYLFEPGDSYGLSQT